MVTSDVDAGIGVATGSAVRAEARIGPLAALVEWFWRGQATRELRAQAPAERLAVSELWRRARLSAEAGRRMLDPASDFEDGNAAALACDQYRQALYWLQRARAAAEAGSPQSLADLEVQAALDRSFIDFAELSAQQQSALARRLQGVVEAALSEASQTKTALELLRFQRFVRVGLVLLTLLGGAVTAKVVMAQREEASDLARGKSWRASSSESLACASPEQNCLSSYFFHTKKEKGPWIEIDLGAPRTFSSVRVINREDCCGERAVPLVLEASSDGKKWRQLDERSKEFTSWRARFAATTARYVRLRARDQTYLHLRRVMILP